MLGSNCDTAHDLHSVVYDLERSICAEVLAHCGFTCVEVATVHVSLPCGFVKHVLHGVELDRHFSDLELVELEATDGLAECLTGVSMLECILVSTDCRTVVASAYQPTLKVEVTDTAVEAVAFLAEDVRLFELNVVEVNLAAAVHAKAELVQRAKLNTGLSHVNHELGEYGRIVGVLGHDYQPLNALGRGDEGLGAVQVDLAVATLVVGGQARNVRTSARSFCRVSVSRNRSTLSSTINAGEVYSSTAITLRLASCIPEK